MSDWQPIETAPKDGTIVLLHSAQCDGNENLVITTRVWVGWWFLSPKQIDDGWECDFGFPGDACEPTHWMPLPPPPKTEPET